MKRRSFLRTVFGAVAGSVLGAMPFAGLAFKARKLISVKIQYVFGQDKGMPIENLNLHDPGRGRPTCDARIDEDVLHDLRLNGNELFSSLFPEHADRDLQYVSFFGAKKMEFKRFWHKAPAALAGAKPLQTNCVAIREATA